MTYFKLATALAAAVAVGNASAAVDWEWTLASSSNKQLYGLSETVTINATFENFASSTGNLTLPNAVLFYSTSQGGIYNGVDGNGLAGQKAMLYSFLANLNLVPGQSSTVTLVSLQPIGSVPVNSYSFDAGIEASTLASRKAVANPFTWSVTAVPEPSQYSLLGLGLLVIGEIKRRKLMPPEIS